MKVMTPSLDQIKDELDLMDGKGWRQIVGLSPSQEYPRGVELFKQEARPEDVYLIEGGLVKLIYVEQNDREIIVGLRSPGWMVGAASVVLNKRYAFSATTLTPCRLRRVTSEVFLDLLKTDREFAWFFHQAQSYELHDQLNQLAGFGCLSARDKLEQLLSQLIPVLAPESNDRRVLLKLPLRHWELAELIGVTPEHLSRVLREMQKEGLVSREKGLINIINVGWPHWPTEKERSAADLQRKL